MVAFMVGHHPVAVRGLGSGWFVRTHSIRGVWHPDGPFGEPFIIRMWDRRLDWCVQRLRRRLLSLVPPRMRRSRILFIGWDIGWDRTMRVHRFSCAVFGCKRFARRGVFCEVHDGIL